jgi:hypothetical protein
MIGSAIVMGIVYGIAVAVMIDAWLGWKRHDD